jgi:hypothetical protein
VILVSVIYPSGLLQYLLWYRAVNALRRGVASLSTDREFDSVVYALPELGTVRYNDVEQWIKEYVEGVDREVLRRLLRKRFSGPFGLGERRLSMYRTADIMRAALSDPSVRVSTA